MTELILLGVIVFLLVSLGYEKWENKQILAKLINALLSKTPQEFRDLELTEKVKPIEVPKKTEPEFIAESEIPDEKFEEMIKKEVA